jgi:hypothetical protein
VSAIVSTTATTTRQGRSQAGGSASSGGFRGARVAVVATVSAARVIARLVPNAEVTCERIQHVIPNAPSAVVIATSTERPHDAA